MVKTTSRSTDSLTLHCIVPLMKRPLLLGTRVWSLKMGDYCIPKALVDKKLLKLISFHSSID